MGQRSRRCRHHRRASRTELGWLSVRGFFRCLLSVEIEKHFRSARGRVKKTTGAEKEGRTQPTADSGQEREREREREGGRERERKKERERKRERKRERDRDRENNEQD